MMPINNKNLKQAVILAGGLGTRLLPITKDIPKPMVEVNGKPFLEYLINQLSGVGIKEVVLLLGYKPDKIKNYFGDGNKFGLKIKYSISDISDDTGTRLVKGSKYLDSYFLLLNCDNYWPFDLSVLIDFYNFHKDPMISTVAYSNKDGFTKNNILVGDDGFVLIYDAARLEKGLNCVDIGYRIVKKEILNLAPKENFSFEKFFFPMLAKTKQLIAYKTDRRYWSIGSLERVPATEKFLVDKKIIFLDRDGVINKKMRQSPPDYVKNWKEFEFLPGVLEAFKILKDKGYKVFIITNQPGIARGFMTEEDLIDINNNMMEQVFKNGGHISNIYHCPHGWDDGCECRKPKAGMLFRASVENFIDLTKSIFVGDDDRDMEAAETAGCNFIMANGEGALLKIVKSLK